MRPAVDWAIPHTSSNSIIHTNGCRLRSELTETQCIDVQFKGLEDIPAKICTVVDTYIKPHTGHIMIKVNKLGESQDVKPIRSSKMVCHSSISHLFKAASTKKIQRIFEIYISS